jgi:hypothetical protein
MLGRRFLILVAVLMGVTALAASVAPRQPVVPEEQREATPTPAPAGTPTLVTVEKEISTVDADTRVAVREGDVVELTISGPERDSVLLLDRMDTIHPESPARCSLLAGEPGEYPIELLEAGRQIGTLVIRDRIESTRAVPGTSTAAG